MPLSLIDKLTYGIALQIEDPKPLTACQLLDFTKVYDKVVRQVYLNQLLQFCEDDQTGSYVVADQVDALKAMDSRQVTDVRKVAFDGAE